MRLAMLRLRHLPVIILNSRHGWRDMTTRQIVIAWRNVDRCSAQYGRAQAAMWVANGTSRDLAECRKFYQHREWYRIYVFPASEANPLGKARLRLPAFTD